jgi:hypothetical protein
VARITRLAVTPGRGKLALSFRALNVDACCLRRSMTLQRHDALLRYLSVAEFRHPTMAASRQGGMGWKPGDFPRLLHKMINKAARPRGLPSAKL